MIALISRFSIWTIGIGVPAGAARPIQKSLASAGLDGLRQQRHVRIERRALIADLRDHPRLADFDVLPGC